MSEYTKNCESVTNYSVTFQSVCMFCFKCTPENSNHSKTNSNINKFVKFLHRFVEQDEIRNSDGVMGLGCCGDCEFIINSFCQEYHQLKCVELQLEWRLSKLVKIMKLANRVPSRIQQLRRMFAEFHHDGSNDKKQKQNHIKDGNGDKVKSFKKFRQRLLRKCSLRISKSQPRVQLERVVTEATTSTGYPLPVSKCGHNIVSGRASTLENILPMSGKQFVTMVAAEDSVHETQVASTPAIKMEIDDDSANVNGGGCRSEDDEKPFFKVEEFHGKELGTQNDSDGDSSENIFDNNLSADDSILVTEHDNNNDVVHRTEGGTCNENFSSQTTDTGHSNFYQDTDIPKVEPCSSSSKNCPINDGGGRLQDADTDMSVDERDFSSELLASGRGMENGSDSDSDYVQDFDCGPHEDWCQDDEKSRVRKQLITKENFSQKNEQSHLVKQEGTSPPVQVDTKQYNLRKRRKMSYTKIEHDSQSEDEEYRISTSEHDEEYDAEEASSLPSCSDTSDGSDSDTEQTPNQVQESSCSLKKPWACEPLFCNLDGCNFKFYGDKGRRIKEHQRLQGEFKCDFCDVVLDNVIKLIAHEKDVHAPVSENRPCTTAEKSFKFHCSRCTFKTKVIHRYHWHFAQTHVKGFKGGTKRTTQHNIAIALKEFIECTICQKGMSKKKLDKHFSTYHDRTNIDSSKIINCTAANCLAYFKKKTQLEVHKTLVHGSVIRYDKDKESDCLEVIELTDKDVEKTIYKCKLCPREYSVFGNYRKHKQLHHNSDIVELPSACEATTPTFPCNISHCKEWFASLEALETHQKLHGTFTCNFCDVVKENAAELAVHETEHAVRSNDQIKTTRGIICNYHCSRCSASFSSKKGLIHHFVQSHLQLSAATNTCPICKAESTTTHLKSHQADFRSKKGQHYKTCHDTSGLDASEIFRCNKCPAYFIKSSQLTVHLVTIHYKYTCPECGLCTQEKRRNRLQFLQRHIEQAHPHVDAFPHLSFRCTWKTGKTCRARFSTLAKLDMHEMWHSNLITEMNCPKCNKKFSTSEKLSKHLSVVHQPRTHMCSECGKAFKTNQVLQQHMEYHKGRDAWKFQCVTCGKKFAEKSKLKLHNRTHTKEKPFVCQFCGVQYSYRQDWKNHLKKNHRKEYDEMDDGSTFRTVDSTHFVDRKGFKKGECILAGKKKK